MRTRLAPLGVAALFAVCLVTALLSSAPMARTTGPERAAVPAMTASVDDDAPGDPGPNDPNVSDPLEDGSPDHPFDSIREAIDYLLNPCSLFIMPGTYHEDLYTPASGCLIQGSGREVTIIESVSGPLLDGHVDSADPAFPPVVSVADVTLRGGDFVVFGGEAPGAPGVMEVALRDATLDHVTLLLFLGGFILDGDRMQVTLNRVDFTGGGIAVQAQGGVIDLDLDSATMAPGFIYFQASGVHTTANLASLVAPTTTISMNRSSGGSQSIHLKDSTIATLDTRSVDYSADATVENVHFTGAGVLIDQGEGSMTASITGSTFDSGGVAAVGRPDQDAPSGTIIGIARSVFHGDGVGFLSNMGNGTLNGVSARIDVDSSLFLGKGISARLRHDPWEGAAGGDFRITLTNNVFDGAAAGVELDYALPDPGPGAARGAFGAEVVNNTFFGAGAGVTIGTAGHAPGQDTVTTLLQNNIIAGGQVGVTIEGTDGHQFDIRSNDVHGNVLADWSGDLPDPTGSNGNISADPLFADVSAHDFHLTQASPCVDAGSTGAQVPGTDHDGAIRPFDGDGDGIADPDIGAFELAWVDADHDGYPSGADCDDDDPAVHPGAADLPGNGDDENCDGARACDPSAVWRNHGRFVSCVARTCVELMRHGSVTQADCQALVDGAARSLVGLKHGRRPASEPVEP